MAKFLNPYCNFIDLLTKCGQTLFSNATEKFESPLAIPRSVSVLGDKTITTWKMLSLAILNDLDTSIFSIMLQESELSLLQYWLLQLIPLLLHQFWQLLLYQNWLHTWMKLKYWMFIWIKLLKPLKKSFDYMGWQIFLKSESKIILDLTQANGHLTTMGRLTKAGKGIITRCILSKILAYQVFEILTDDASQVIDCQSELYTWKDSYGLDKETHQHQQGFCFKGCTFGWAVKSSINLGVTPLFTSGLPPGGPRNSMS